MKEQTEAMKRAKAKYRTKMKFVTIGLSPKDHDLYDYAMSKGGATFVKELIRKAKDSE